MFVKKNERKKKRSDRTVHVDLKLAQSIIIVQAGVVKISGNLKILRRRADF